jgi:hypothetical protein
MPDYGKRIMEWMKENRYVQYGHIRVISPMAFGCKDIIIEKYVNAAVAMGELEQIGSWLVIKNIKRYDGEVFPWENMVIK